MSIAMAQTIQHKYAYTNGIRMHYAEIGTGPLVLLCHGWPESWFSWRHQLVALAEAGFRVVAPDQRGYGSTEAPAAVGAYNILELAGDLVGFLEALGEKKAVLIGHDWGSMVATVTSILRPDLFRGLGMMSVPYRPRGAIRPSAQFHLSSRERHFYQEYFQEPDRVERELELNIRRSLASVLYSGSGECRQHPTHRKSLFLAFDKGKRFIDALVAPDALPGWLSETDLGVFEGQFSKSGFRGGINWYRNIDRNWELTPFLNGAKILQPSIFITGSLDGVLRMASVEYEALEENAPALRGKHLIEGAGHWIQQERPMEVSKLLIEFATSVIGSGQ